MPSELLRKIISLAQVGDDKLFSPHALADSHFIAAVAAELTDEGKMSNGVFAYSGEFGSAADLEGLHFGKAKPQPVDPSAPVDGWEQNPTAKQKQAYASDLALKQLKDQKIAIRRALVPITPGLADETDIEKFDIVPVAARKKLVRAFFLQKKADIAEAAGQKGRREFTGPIPDGFAGYLHQAYIMPEWVKVSRMTVVVSPDNFHVVTLFPVA